MFSNFLGGSIKRRDKIVDIQILSDRYKDKSYSIKIGFGETIFKMDNSKFTARLRLALRNRGLSFKENKDKEKKLTIIIVTHY